MRALALLLATTSLWAAHEVGIARAIPGGGMEKIIFREEKSGWVLVKDTTAFDPSPDQRLGTLVPKSKQGFGDWPKIIEDVKRRHADALTMLKEQGTKPEILNPPLGHGPFVVVDGTLIGKHSPAYEILATMVNKQLTGAYDLRDGVELAAGNELRFHKAGKVSSKEKFEAQNFCRAGAGPRPCNIRRWGKIYLP